MSVSMASTLEFIDIDLVLADQLPKQSPVLLRRLRRARYVALMTFEQPADKARLEFGDSFRFGSLKAFRVGSLARAGQVDLRSLDLRPLRERHRAFHYMLQFAHISRPLVQQKFLHGARRDVLGTHSNGYAMPELPPTPCRLSAAGAKKSAPSIKNTKSHGLIENSPLNPESAFGPPAVPGEYCPASALILDPAAFVPNRDATSHCCDRPVV